MSSATPRLDLDNGIILNAKLAYAKFNEIDLTNMSLDDIFFSNIVSYSYDKYLCDILDGLRKAGFVRPNNVVRGRPRRINKEVWDNLQNLSEIYDVSAIALVRALLNKLSGEISECDRNNDAVDALLQRTKINHDIIKGRLRKSRECTIGSDRKAFDPDRLRKSRECTIGSDRKAFDPDRLAYFKSKDKRFTVKEFMIDNPPNDIVVLCESTKNSSPILAYEYDNGYIVKPINRRGYNIWYATKTLPSVVNNIVDTTNLGNQYASAEAAITSLYSPPKENVDSCLEECKC